jgi:hypothetical protein
MDNTTRRKTPKLTESYCIMQIKNFHIKIIKNKIINKLKKIKEPLLSNDSRLKTFWDEYCAQLQDEQSFYFDAYEDTIKNYIIAEMELQPQPIQNLIDFCENEDFDQNNNADQFVYDRQKAIDEILQDIEIEASNFESKRLNNYLGNY